MLLLNFKSFLNVIGSELGWVGLDLFNDDTRPSGHISRPTQVNMSQSCFHSLNSYSSLIIFYTSGGLVEVKITSYQIEESCFSQEFY